MVRPNMNAQRTTPRGSRVVARPEFRFSGGRPGKYPVLDVMATLATPGEAIAVPLNGVLPGAVASALRQSIARRDPTLHLRHRRDGKDVLCWVEPRTVSRPRKKGAA